MRALQPLLSADIEQGVDMKSVIKVASGLVGHIIGKQGARITSIMDDSRAKIKVWLGSSSFVFWDF